MTITADQALLLTMLGFVLLVALIAWVNTRSWP